MATPRVVATRIPVCLARYQHVKGLQVMLVVSLLLLVMAPVLEGFPVMVELPQTSELGLLRRRSR